MAQICAAMDRWGNGAKRDLSLENRGLLQLVARHDPESAQCLQLSLLLSCSLLRSDYMLQWILGARIAASHHFGR